MSQVRLAVLATLLAAGCYTDAPPQSTLPEPQYVAGPPGGAMDPGFAARPAAGPAQVGDDGDGDDDVPTEAPAQVPPDAAPPGAAAPGAPGDLAQVGGPPGAPGADASGTAAVSDDEIDATLDGYGQWIGTDDYGQVWRPDATVVGVDFTPYESGGSWAYTDAGWGFACDYPWGWLPFHYGRWAWFGNYWGWIPGHRWSPAWVEWRHGGGVVGWRPLPPNRGSGHRWHGGDAPFRDHRHPEQHDAHWRFAATSDFSRPHIRAHLFGNPAEGLRVTTAVAALPLRGATTVRSADLMRSRFATSRLAQPGLSRGVGPQTYQPPGRGYQPPGRSYQPPARSYQPPARSYQPPAQAYRPPVYQPPGRSYQPPARSYQPGRSYAPIQGYRPPMSSPPRSYQPPVRSYQPPAHTSMPSHSWSSGSSSSGSSSSSSHASSSSSSSHSSSSGGGHHR
ncbi:MAG TPA: DUF6600 domain-containing protein [Kofleriaceae bacterium]|nr:DUF6600 domain-containing protein [Kofleriaceae bacterium]